jgi:hypothetical protein
VYSACFSNLVHSIQGLNTTGTLVSICQNDKFSFSFLKSTYLGLAQAITSTAATLGFWYIPSFRQKGWLVKFIGAIITVTYASFCRVVCCNGCGDYLDPTMGHDRDLDPEVWVGLSLSLLIFFINGNFRFHNEWEFRYSHPIIEPDMPC